MENKTAEQTAPGKAKQGLTEIQLKDIQKSVDPKLLREIPLGTKLKTLRNLTNQTNGVLAKMFGENKRTFESWVGGGEREGEGRYVPEGDKLKRVHAALVRAANQYIKARLSKKAPPKNAYSDFPTLFKLLDFNDAMSVLYANLEDMGKSFDFKSGNLT